MIYSTKTIICSNIYAGGSKVFLSVVLFVTCQGDRFEDGLDEPPAHYVSKRFKIAVITVS